MINCDFKEHIPFALKVKERANSLGLSLNGYITQLIEKDMQA